jgi:streptogramin lyase
MLALAVTAMLIGGCSTPPASDHAATTPVASLSSTGADTASLSPLPDGQRYAGTVVDRVRVPRNPDGLSFGLGYLWVGTYAANAVVQISPDAGTVVRTIPVPSRPLSVAATAFGVFAAEYGGSSVVHIDPASGTVAGAVDVGSQPVGFARIGDRLWVCNQASQDLSEIDPRAGRVTRTVAVPGLHGGFPTAGYGALWIADLDGTSNAVWRIDPRRGVVTAKIPVGADPAQVAFGFGSGWATSADGLTRFDPGTGVIKARITGSEQLDGIAITDDAVWVGSLAEEQVVRIDPRNNRATGVVPGIAGPRQIVAVGNDLWVNEFTGGTVARIHPMP